MKAPPQNVVLIVGIRCARKTTYLKMLHTFLQQANVPVLYRTSCSAAFLEAWCIEHNRGMFAKPNPTVFIDEWSNYQFDTCDELFDFAAKHPNINFMLVVNFDRLLEGEDE